MTSLSWCLKQSRGIEIAEPNDNLSDEYAKDADFTLTEMINASGKWKVIMAYYACYNALYSILMKAGIKSEIHECTIEIIKLIVGFDDSDYEFMKNLKNDRIRTQYYLEKKEVKDYNKIKEFVFKCKTILASEDLNYLREEIKNHGTKK